MDESVKEAKKIARALHPPRCPECGKELDCLINVCNVWNVYYFRVNDEGEVDYELKDSQPGVCHTYECPYCHKILFEGEEDATKFLKGED
ncbi:MAG: hypothetical protein QXT26_08375 [Thermoproteota archaeon]